MKKELKPSIMKYLIRGLLLFFLATILLFQTLNLGLGFHTIFVSFVYIFAFVSCWQALIIYKDLVYIKFDDYCFRYRLGFFSKVVTVNWKDIDSYQQIEKLPPESMFGLLNDLIFRNIFKDQYMMRGLTIIEKNKLKHFFEFTYYYPVNSLLVFKEAYSNFKEKENRF